MALNNIPGLAGYLGMRNQDRSEAMGNLQAVQSGIGSVLQMQQAERAAQMAPLQQQLVQAQVGQAQGLAQQRQQEQAFQQMLPQLLEQSMGPDGQPDMAKFSSLLMQTPGGLKPGMDLRRAEEDRAMRVQQGQAMIEQRTQQAAQMHEARMAQAQTAAERAAETARHNEFMRNMAAQTRALTAAVAGGSGRNDTRTPRIFSIDGKNIDGSVDRYGNRYDESGQLVRNFGPQITTTDQKQASDTATALEATKVVEQNLSRMEDLVLGPVDPKTGLRTGGSPNSIAGPAAPLLGAARYTANALGFDVNRPGTEFSQLVESTLNSVERTGKLSNQQKNELRGMFKTGMTGDRDSVLKGIQLMRNYAGIRESGANVAVGRVRPGSQATQSAPTGIDPRVWGVMTPEERALWQK